jgi:hypothetical protein
MSHFLEFWRQYLSEDDYLYLVNFVENIKHDIVNDQMILLFGKGANGKTTLISDIEYYVGKYKCSPIYNMWSTVYENEYVQLFNIEDFDINNDYDDKLENIIHSGKSIISTTVQDPHLALLDNANLAAHVRIIDMKYTFPH